MELRFALWIYKVCAIKEFPLILQLPQIWMLYHSGLSLFLFFMHERGSQSHPALCLPRYHLQTS